MIEDMQTLAVEKLSIKDYLDREQECDTRNEYINGVVRSMTGGKPAHNQIVGNLYAALNFALKRRPYCAFVTDQRLWIPDRNIYTYPDVMVVEEPLQLQEGRQDTIINPIVIAEVLSDSTRGYDQGEKFTAYRTIEALQEYLLLEQEKMLAMHYVKQQSDRWLFLEYSEPETVISLPVVSFNISLADLYDKVAVPIE